MNDTKNKSQLNKFIELVNDQFSYGGKKYGLNSNRESTDVLFDKHGHCWLFGTMDKYTFRYRNLKRERDILKIATYCFITWLKRGFFIKYTGLTDVIDTNIETKEREFPKFCKDVTEYIEFLDEAEEKINKPKRSDDENLNLITSILERLSKQMFRYAEKNDLFAIFRYSYHIWKNNYSEVKEHDTDTYNESK